VADAPCSSGALTARFPASSPYMLSVGATNFIDPTVIGAEMAVSDGPPDGHHWNLSSGGFSNAFRVPAYQAHATAAYLNATTRVHALPAAPLFDRTGRGIPDVAALSQSGGPPEGNCWLIYNPNNPDNPPGDGSGWDCDGGTSASAPFWAAMIARLNAARLAVGKPTMGFIHPFLCVTHDTVYPSVSFPGPMALLRCVSAIPATQVHSGCSTRWALRRDRGQQR
jgi:tripeptidyl-peptidase-1